jgi:hypothetical protein
MKLRDPKTRKKHEDFAPLIAEIVDQASRGYADFSGHLLPPSNEEAEARGCEAVRRMGLRFSIILADVNRAVDEETVDLDGQAFPPPPGVVKALRDLEQSFTLMSGIQSYRDLLDQPLVPWEQIRTELDAPESREWMKTALAAY